MSSVIIDGREVDVQDAFSALSTRIKDLQTNLDETIAGKLADFDKTNATRSPMDITLGGGEGASRPYFDLVSSIPTFDGGRADFVVPFFDNIDSVGELSGWNETQKTQVIKLKLTGAALQFFKSDESCKEAKTAEEIKTAFVHRFGDSLPDHYYFEELASVKQMKNETIEQFSDRVKRISDKTIRTNANEEVNKILKEETDRRAMEAFLRGLYGEIGRQTRIKFPKNFREAVGTAIAINNLEKRPNREEDKPKRVFQAPLHKSCFNCGRPGHIARNCRKPRIPECGYCKKKGHVEADCRHKASLGKPGCTYCKKPGHSEEKCWKKNNRGNGNPYRGRGDQHFTPAPAPGQLNSSGEPKSAAGAPVKN